MRVSASRDDHPEERLNQILSISFLQSGLRVFPGQRSGVRFQVKTRLVLIVTLPPATLAGPYPAPFLPSSLPATLAWIDHLPFARIPLVILEGFRSHQAALSASNPDLAFQYGKTLDLVERYLHSDAVQLALMQCIVLVNCTERLNVVATPPSHGGAHRLQWVVPGKSAAGHSIERWTIVLLTKVCWFLFPEEYYPQDQVKFNDATGM